MRDQTSLHDALPDLMRQLGEVSRKLDEVGCQLVALLHEQRELLTLLRQEQAVSMRVDDLEKFLHNALLGGEADNDVF